MTVCCGVCNSSFKDSGALQQHKKAKFHNTPASGPTSGRNVLSNQAPTKSHSSKTVPLVPGEMKSSAGIIFKCDSCDRSFKSQQALVMHAEDKHRLFTVTEEGKIPATGLLRCDICGRCGFRSQIAVIDHKRDSKDHQTRKQHSAPLQTRSHIGMRVDDGQSLHIEHALALTVNKLVQCDLRSCNSQGTQTCDSDVIPSYSRAQQCQDVQSPKAEHHRLRAVGYSHDGSNQVFRHSDILVDTGEGTIDSVVQNHSLRRDGSSDFATLATPSFSSCQSASTVDDPVQHLPDPQSVPTSDEVYAPVLYKSLKHLGNVWSAIPSYEQPFVLKILRSICHPYADLDRHGYQLRPKTFADLMGEQKCKACKSALCNFTIYSQTS